MLLELKVSNFAIIENLEIQFASGLNILSGETGAGKSVLLKSLALLMGHKGSSDQIRSGCQQAAIEGCFDLGHRKDIVDRLSEMGIKAEDKQLIVRRVISEDKSRIYINGSLSSLHSLRELVSPLIEVAGVSAPLIEMTGQFDSRNLLSKSYQLDLLDYYAGAMEKRHEYQEQFSEWRTLLSEIRTKTESQKDRAQRLDYLHFQRSEIAELNLAPFEDLELEQKIKQLKGVSKISTFLEQTEQALDLDDDSAINRLQKVLQRAQELKSVGADIEAPMAQLEQANALIKDAIFELSRWSNKLDLDPSQLDQLEDRLSRIRRLQKKFGPSVDEILSALLKIETEISELENHDLLIEKMTAQAKIIESRLRKLSDALHKQRMNSAKVLAESVSAELSDLNMKGVLFRVFVQDLAELGPTGLSDVEFQSQTSQKDPFSPLSKFASGGELSRILLSLKRVIGSTAFPRTYLFDEVDSGVSGPTAEKVGKKLKSIAKGQQVICVTHLPQVAAFGDSHFFIQKSPHKGGVQMEIGKLNSKDRVQEIARLISGEKITKTSLAHAEQLLTEAR